MLESFRGLRKCSDTVNILDSDIPPAKETVSQCHPEAVAEGSRFRKKPESLDSSPAAQNDIRVIFSLAGGISESEMFHLSENLRKLRKPSRIAMYSRFQLLLVQDFES
jgi:hypothetical protein